ncbi:RING-box protein 1a [Hibiscus syriacus]|uniref:RING-box protein 1a n=1 Tax=Hibiscus syriacus TaxID=106335 RepID=A0A6A2Y7Q9_HIBSY|nr:RING-box protein 1a [Hibiscus syriacus]
MATLDSDVPMVPVGEASSSTSPSTSTKKLKRFEIKKWSAVAHWAWGIECQANQQVPPGRNALLRGVSATMHSTFTPSADVEDPDGSSKSMVTRSFQVATQLNLLTFLDAEEGSLFYGGATSSSVPHQQNVSAPDDDDNDDDDDGGGGGGGDDDDDESEESEQVIRRNPPRDKQPPPYGTDSRCMHR